MKFGAQMLILIPGVTQYPKFCRFEVADTPDSRQIEILTGLVMIRTTS